MNEIFLKTADIAVVWMRFGFFSNVTRNLSESHPNRTGEGSTEAPANREAELREHVSWWRRDKDI